MELTFVNHFHSTSHTTSDVVRTYVSDAGCDVAIVPPSVLDAADRECCGMADCLCGGAGLSAIDANGTVYLIDVEG